VTAPETRYGCQSRYLAEAAAWRLARLCKQQVRRTPEGTEPIPKGAAGTLTA
jgi:hypothetical protein